MNAGGQFLISRLHGEWKLFLNSVLFAGVALAFFAIALWGSRADQAPEKRAWSDAERLIARILIFALAGVFVGVLVSGAAEVKDRWLQPILFLAPLFLAVVLERSIATDLPLKRFAVVGAICALIVIPGLAINMLYARDGKAPSIGQLDYARLFAVTRAEGTFGTVVSDGPQLPGNLRLFDTSITPVHAEMPNAESRIHLPALFVWFGEGMNPTVSGLMNAAGIATPPANIKAIELTYKYYPDRSEKVSYVILPAR